MPIFICDQVLDRIYKSLKEQIRIAYSEGNQLNLPIFIGAGYSGNQVAKGIIENFSHDGISIEFFPMEIGDKGKDLKIKPNPDDYRNKPVLICDSIVNTGNTLKNLKNEFLENGAKEVKTLTIFLRNTADFIPNFWVTHLQENEIVFFDMEKYPIHCYDKGNIRKLNKGDCGKKLNCNKPYIRPIIDDYYAQQTIDPTYNGFIIENTEGLIGLLYLKKLSNKIIYLHTIVIDDNSRRKGFGGTLLEFLDDHCIINNIQKIILHTEEENVPFYEECGYQKTGKSYDLPSYGSFFEMESTI